MMKRNETTPPTMLTASARAPVAPMPSLALRLLASGLLLGLTLTVASLAHAGTAGQVTHLSGILSVKKPDGSTKLLSVKSEVQEGDVLTTENDAYARVKFVDGGELVLRPNSQLKVATYSFSEKEPKNDNIFLNLLKGGLRAVTGLVGKRNRDAVNYSTATATIGIRGTHFGMLFCNADCASFPMPGGMPPPPDGLHVDVASGAIMVTNPAGQQLVNAGQFGFVGGPNMPPAIVPPQQGIQVTMPPQISQNNAPGQTGGIGKNKDSDCVAN